MPNESNKASGVGEASVDCDEARPLLARFVDGNLEMDEQLLLRRHLTDCEDCRGVYRASVEGAAHLSRTLRAKHPGGKGISVGSPRTRLRAFRLGGGHNRKGARLRMILLPAFFIFLITWVGKMGMAGPRATVEWIEGEVWASGRVMDFSLDSIQLLRGEWCWSRQDGRAVLRVADVELELEEETQVLIEDAESGRVRLERGRLTVRGSCEITTPFGFVEVLDGDARVAVVNGVLGVDCEGGLASLLSPSGQWQLGPGESASTGPAHAADD